MADPIAEALKLLGFATPFAYAAGTFGLFHSLDKEVSDEARIAISAWLQPREYDHPLDAIGYVAAILVFEGAGALRLIGVIG
jgi:hypothetical protein